LPGWQQFADAHRDDAFEVIAIAIEHQGAEAARPFVEAAGATFPVLVDNQGILSARFGFKVVPNGLLIDEDGVVRYAKYGGFDIAHAEDVAAVERFIAGDDPGSSPEPEVPYTLDTRDRDLVETKMKLGRALDELGRRDEAIAAWREALRLDPKNLTIRKQIWAVEYPEKFHPAIDWDWQRAQLSAETAREIAAGQCGPDGCPVPLSGRH
jgi:tetratricopeptide (TPR) repeat protein